MCIVVLDLDISSTVCTTTLFSLHPCFIGLKTHRISSVFSSVCQVQSQERRPTQLQFNISTGAATRHWTPKNRPCHRLTSPYTYPLCSAEVAVGHLKRWSVPREIERTTSGQSTYRPVQTQIEDHQVMTLRKVAQRRTNNFMNRCWTQQRTDRNRRSGSTAAGQKTSTANDLTKGCPNSGPGGQLRPEIHF